MVIKTLQMFSQPEKNKTGENRISNIFAHFSFNIKTNNLSQTG